MPFKITLFLEVDGTESGNAFYHPLLVIKYAAMIQSAQTTIPSYQHLSFEGLSHIKMKW